MNLSLPTSIRVSVGGSELRRLEAGSLAFIRQAKPKQSNTHKENIVSSTKTASKTKAKTKLLRNLKSGDTFIHTTKKGKQIPVTAVKVNDMFCKRGKLATKGGVVIKTLVKSGPNAGKERLIVQYRFSGGSENSRYANLDEKVTLA